MGRKMEKKLANGLKTLLLGAILLFVLFSVIAFAVPFNNKFNASFFISYFAPAVAIITLIFFVAVALSGTEYNNDAFGKKVLIFGSCFVITQTISSIILLICNSNMNLETYVSGIVSAVIFVAFAFLLGFSAVNNKE
jgi:Na+/glutamate symporter